MTADHPLPQPAEIPASFAPRSLADLKAFVADHPELGASQRRDMASAIASLADFLGTPAESLPADGRRLRHRVERLHHAQLGVSKKRLDNVIGGVKRALRIASRQFPGARRRAALCPAWAPLRDALPPQSKYVYHLSGFIGFCSRAGIAPEEVDDAAFEAFFEDLQAHSLRKDPRRAYRNACTWWNQAVADFPGWPQCTVTVLSFKAPPKTIPLAGFPGSFAADLDAFEAGLLSPSPFRGKAKRRRRDGKRRHRRAGPYASDTAGKWVEMLHRAGSVLVECGHCELGEVTGIAALCESGAAEAILQHYWTAAGERATAYTATLAKVLAIAADVHLEAPDAQLDDLWANVGDMSPGSKGLTEKNMARLRVFNEDANKLLLLEAPEALWRDPASPAPRCKPVRRKRDAVDLLVAAAVAILLYAPVRLKNLTGIKLSTNWRPANAAGEGGLYFPAGEVKNDVELDFPLPAEAVRIVHDYMAHARHWWLGPGDDELFPFGESKAARAHFGDLLAARLRRATGLRVNCHLFRHIAAKFYLDDHPGEYEVVRLLLGHRSLSTTVNFYCGLERDAAIEKYEHSVLQTQRRLAADPATSTRRRRRTRRQTANTQGGAA